MFSMAEVAALWSVSVDTIERLVRRQQIRTVVVSERRRIPASALDEYREAHEDRV
jgi:excisionase family DNA binding protein